LYFTPLWDWSPFADAAGKKREYEHQPAFKLTLIGSLSIVHTEDFSKFFSAAVKEKLGFFYWGVCGPYFLLARAGVAIESSVP
jgi:hypothetical protein